MTQAYIKNSSGSSFLVSNTVLNSAGTPFDVANDVLDSDGNAFTIFSLIAIEPYTHVPVSTIGRLMDSGNTTGRLYTTTNIRGRIT